MSIMFMTSVYTAYSNDISNQFKEISLTLFFSLCFIYFSWFSKQEESATLKILCPLIYFLLKVSDARFCYKQEVLSR